MLGPDDLRDIGERFLVVVQRHTGRPFPSDPHERLEIAIKAVFNSWMGKRDIDYRREDFAARIRELTGGRGIDVILDHIGAKYLAANLDSLAVGGRLVQIGLMGGAKAEVNLGALLARRLAIIGSTLRGRSVDEKAAIVRGFRDRFGHSLADGRLRPVVDRVLPLAEAPEAH